MTEHSPATLENKAMKSADVHEVRDDMLRAFEAYKESNDAKIVELEKRGAADVVTEEKLNRLNRAIDEHRQLLDALSLKAGRPALSAGGRDTAAAREHKSAFDGFMRHGETAGLRRLEEKALSVGTDADGGYLVPDETETTVMRALRDISPIRTIAGQRTVSASVYKKPFAVTGAASGWVAETAARPETATPTLAELSFPTMELYAMPAATQSLLDDAAVNIDDWLADEVRVAFGEQEGTAFVTGNGVNKPRGFLDYDKVAQASWTWGDIGYVATGVSADFSATDPADDLIDLIYTLKPAIGRTRPG